MTNHAVSTLERDDLHFESRNSYDYFRIDGATLNYNVLRQRLKAIARASGERGHNLILVENNFRNNLSIIDLFRIITELPAIGYSQFHLAFADSNPEHVNNNDFANTVAVNRGLRMRAFGSVHEAEGWLLAA